MAAMSSRSVQYAVSADVDRHTGLQRRIRSQALPLFTAAAFKDAVSPAQLSAFVDCARSSGRLFLSLFVCLALSPSVCPSISLYISFCAWLCRHLYVPQSLCISLCAWICLHPYVPQSLCISLCMFGFVSIRMSLSLLLSLCLLGFPSIGVCPCVFVSFLDWFALLPTVWCVFASLYRSLSASFCVHPSVRFCLNPSSVRPSYFLFLYA